jgi:hypothetical protein
MNHVLQVQAVHGVGDGGSERRGLVGRKRTAIDEVLKALAVDLFGHEIGRLGEVSHRHEARHVGSR